MENCPPNDMGSAAAALRHHAFTALLAGDTPRVAEIAEAASRDAVAVAHALASLEADEQLERDGERLVGAHGLTRQATPHTLTIDGRRLYTWCAYDAVAIPVALGATARAETTCPTCHRLLVVDIAAGRLPTTTRPVLWMPTGTSDDVIDDPPPGLTSPPQAASTSPTMRSWFCAYANLFCTPAHLDVWRRGAGDPLGEMVTFAEIPALAQRSWGGAAPPP